MSTPTYKSFINETFVLRLHYHHSCCRLFFKPNLKLVFIFLQVDTKVVQITNSNPKCYFTFDLKLDKAILQVLNLKVIENPTPRGIYQEELHNRMEIQKHLNHEVMHTSSLGTSYKLAFLIFTF